MTQAPDMQKDHIATIPAHVPPHLVRDFDFLRMEGEHDLYDWWGQLQNGPDIFYTPRHYGHWVATRHEDLSHILESHTDFSSISQTVPREGKPFRIPPIEYDPPEHADFRRLIAPFFTPKSIGDLQAKAKDLAVASIEQFHGRGECEFVAEFALIMPIGIFMSLGNLPEKDRLLLLELADELVRGESAEIQARGFARSFAYLERVYAERRLHPGKDIFSVLLTGIIAGGRNLSDSELLGMGALLLAGGLDSVASMMGFVAMFLAQNPDHRRRLVNDPALIPGAIEELMRRHQIANIARVVARDIVYKGVAMKAGEMILTPTSMAGLDERRYEDPLRVDFDRADKRSLVFGRGAHQCIGAFLARTELQVFLGEWLKRIPDFAIKPGAKPVVVPGRGNSVRYLPLVWDVRNER